MITITYKCEKTGQEMVISISERDDDLIDVKTKFNPMVSKDTPDPFGIMGKIFMALKS